MTFFARVAVLTLAAVAVAGAEEARAPRPLVLPVTMRLRAADLELIACRMTRAHEALVLLDITPEDFAAKMKEIGLRPAEEWKDPALRRPGGPRRGDPDDDFVEHWGDRVIVSLQWDLGGRTIRSRVEDLIWDVPEGRPLRRTAMVYQGSPGDEVEMPLTLKGLNAKDAFGSHLVLPRAYLDDSYRPVIPFYRTHTARLPKEIAENAGGLKASLIIEPATEERALQTDIDAAEDAAGKAALEALLPAARRIDAAKARVRELMPVRAALLKKGLETALKPDADEAALARLEAEGRAVRGEIKSLHKQIRRDLLETEIAYARRDAEAFRTLRGKLAADAAAFAAAKQGVIGQAKTPEAAQLALLQAVRDLDGQRDNQERYRELLGGPSAEKDAALDRYGVFLVHGAGDIEGLRERPERLPRVLAEPEAWKNRTLREFEILREVAEQERIALDVRRAFDARLGKGESPTDGERLRMNLTAAIADNRAEAGRAEIRRLREGFNLDVEERRNAEILARGMELSEFARKIVERLQTHVYEAVTRAALCNARIAAAGRHLALLDAPADAKPALEKELADLRAAVGTAQLRHQVHALAEEIDEKEFQIEKALGDPEEAELRKQLEALKARRAEVLEKLKSAAK